MLAAEPLRNPTPAARARAYVRAHAHMFMSGIAGHKEPPCETMPRVVCVHAMTASIGPSEDALKGSL